MVYHDVVLGGFTISVSKFDPLIWGPSPVLPSPFAWFKLWALIRYWVNHRRIADEGTLQGFSLVFSGPVFQEKTV